MSLFSKQRGFTLTELIVTIGVTTVLFAVVLYGQANYSEKASLRNAADTIILDLARVQTYGTAVKETAFGSGIYQASYGLEFNTITAQGGSATDYIYYADMGGTQYVYDDGFSCPTSNFDKCIEKIRITGNNTITSICWSSYTNGGGCGGRADIVFTRPSSVGRVIVWDSTGVLQSIPNIFRLTVTLRSPDGTTRAVDLRTIGTSATL